MKTNNIINHTFLLISFLLFIITSCKEDVVEEEKMQSSLNMQMKSTSSALIKNTSIYVFDPNSKFIEKKMNVLRLSDVLSTTMKVGLWNLVLLTCDNEDVSNNIVLPPYLGIMSSYPMWRTRKTDDGLFLSQTPEELRYALIDDTEIKKDIITNKNTTLNRNVAKIQVILSKHTGFDPVEAGKNQFSFVELLEVPTTLTWDGKLYPNKTNPELSDKPIREYFKFDSGEKADTVTFVVPAHRGSDAFEIYPKDTTTHKVRLRASMPLNGAEYYGKGAIDIPYVPKVNSITQIYLVLRGEPNTTLNIRVTVKDWEEMIEQSEQF